MVHEQHTPDMPKNTAFALYFECSAKNTFSIVCNHPQNFKHYTIYVYNGTFMTG